MTKELKVKTKGKEPNKHSRLCLKQTSKEYNNDISFNIKYNFYDDTGAWKQV